MKVNEAKILLMVSAALLSLSSSLSAQSFSSSGALPKTKNRAILSSPRTLEEYPEILRARSVARKVGGTERPAKTKNRALAASPRFQEENPELLRVGPSGTRSQARVGHKSDSLSTLTKNEAMAKSPRFLEEHPEISRGKPVIELAPLK